jgi:hypothetical protein
MHSLTNFYRLPPQVMQLEASAEYVEHVPHL